MSKRIPRLLVIDMIECVNNLLSYTTGISYEEFLKDSKTRDAVLRNIQVLGEAANRLPQELRIEYPDIEWSKIIRSRNIVVHDYDGIDYSIVWKIVTFHSPPLKD